MPVNEYTGYDTKLSNGEAPVLEVWRMWRISSLPLLQGPLCLGAVGLDRVPSMGLIELFNHLTVYKEMSDIKSLVAC